MAKLVYNLLSMQELRRRLKECQLSVQGSRDQLVRRHQDFIHLFNAECDSLNPKSGGEMNSVFIFIHVQETARNNPAA